MSNVKSDTVLYTLRGSDAVETMVVIKGWQGGAVSLVLKFYFDKHFIIEIII